jgi:hypothetical protein
MNRSSGYLVGRRVAPCWSRCTEEPCARFDPVPHRPTPRSRAVGAWCPSGLATLLVIVALNAPDRLEELGPDAFVRLPLEALVYLAVVLALPPSLDRVRVPLPLLAGVALGPIASSRSSTWASWREVTAQDLLTGLRGNDVLFVFVETTVGWQSKAPPSRRV